MLRLSDVYLQCESIGLSAAALLFVAPAGLSPCSFCPMKMSPENSAHNHGYTGYMAHCSSLPFISLAKRGLRPIKLWICAESLVRKAARPASSCFILA